jgi:hypothetical protein
MKKGSTRDDLEGESKDMKTFFIKKSFTRNDSESFRKSLEDCGKSISNSSFLKSPIVLFRKVTKRFLPDFY